MKTVYLQQTLISNYHIGDCIPGHPWWKTQKFVKLPFKFTHVDAIFTACSRTFTLFWSKKASLIAEIFQVSVCLCVLSSRQVFIFWWIFPLFYFSYLLSYIENCLLSSHLVCNYWSMLWQHVLPIICLYICSLGWTVSTTSINLHWARFCTFCRTLYLSLHQLSSNAAKSMYITDSITNTIPTCTIAKAKKLR
jgi:hypothetical protein